MRRDSVGYVRSLALIAKFLKPVFLIGHASLRLLPSDAAAFPPLTPAYGRIHSTTTDRIFYSVTKYKKTGFLSTNRCS